MMKLLDLHKKFLAVLLLAFMALGMAACSSTEESSDTGDTSSQSGGDEDCSKYTNQVDIQECEVRNAMRN